MAKTEEEKLLEKLRKIEALHAGATTDGERDAAAHVAEQLRQRLREYEVLDPPIEYSFSVNSPQSRRVLLALLRRYGLTPYRFRGQRWSTVRARVSTTFVDTVLWPEYTSITDELTKYVDAFTDRVIKAAIHKDVSDEQEVPTPRQLG
jgi:hypothetical protein